MEQNEIIHITTAVRGRQKGVDLTIELNIGHQNQYIVKCPEQTLKSSPTKKRYKAIFDMEKCNKCPLKDKCSIYKNKGKYYFEHSDYSTPIFARGLIAHNLFLKLWSPDYF